MNLNINILIYWNRQGIFPGKDESLSSFEKRVYLLTPYLKERTSLPKELLISCDIQPYWVIKRVKRLPFWCGARVELNDNALPVVFLPKNRKWGPPISMLFAHELIHAARFPLDASLFEEIAAHAADPYSWRQKLGAFFSSQISRGILIALIFSHFLYDLALLVWDFPFLGSLILKSILILYILFEFLKALKIWSIFSKCLKKMNSLVQEKFIWAVMIRLTDDEVIAFAKMSKEQIYRIFSMSSKVEIRRWLIFKMYFR